jgi:hypothetical protein
MSVPAYLRATSREDLSQWVVHLVRVQDGYTALMGILDGGGGIAPSIVHSITRYHLQGAACFYDCPPSLWSRIVETNPNGRCPFGLIVQKRALWYLGGRPAIYTDLDNPDVWPPAERFRVIRTDLTRDPMPVDWMHEREWRMPNGLGLQRNLGYCWWWPLVPDSYHAAMVFDRYANVGAIYQMDRCQIVERQRMVVHCG